MSTSDLRQNYLSKSATELLDDFGAGQASPGSGSAAALMGLLSAKLITTVCQVTTRNSEKKADKFALLERQVESLVPRLKELFEKDADEFHEIVEAMKANKLLVDKDAKSKSRREINDKLEVATDNIFEIIDACFELISHGVVAFDLGSKHVRGDSGAAISSGIAAVSSGLFVATLNMKTIGNRVYARENIVRCKVYRERLEELQASAFGRVISLDKEALEFIQPNLPGV